jgi:hypothetical protein
MPPRFRETSRRPFMSASASAMSDTSGGEEDDDTSASDFDSDDDEVVEYDDATDSLGRVLPLFQREVSVEHDYVRCHAVVVHSRDRNVFREHLFAFHVAFGTNTNFADASRCTAVADDDDDDDTDCLGDAAPVPPAPTPAVPNRQCSVERAFTEVQSLSLAYLLLPHASFVTEVPSLPSEATPSSSSPPSIGVAVPQEVYVELTPSGSNNNLHGTSPMVANSAFMCAQSHASATHTNYRMLNSEYLHDTPINYLNHIVFRIHSSQERLVRHPFEAGSSPDIHHIRGIAFRKGTPGTTPDTMQVQLTDMRPPLLAAPRISAGQQVSFRDVVLVAPAAAETAAADDETKWRDLLSCTLRRHAFVVLGVDADAQVVTLDTQLLLGVSDERLPESDVTVATTPSGSLLLNESMQYSFLLQFKCVEKRLRQSTATTATAAAFTGATA